MTATTKLFQFQPLPSTEIIRDAAGPSMTNRNSQERSTAKGEDTNALLQLAEAAENETILLDVYGVRATARRKSPHDPRKDEGDRFGLLRRESHPIVVPVPVHFNDAQLQTPTSSSTNPLSTRVLLILLSNFGTATFLEARHGPPSPIRLWAPQPPLKCSRRRKEHHGTPCICLPSKVILHPMDVLGCPLDDEGRATFQTTATASRHHLLIITPVFLRDSDPSPPSFIRSPRPLSAAECFRSPSTPPCQAIATFGHACDDIRPTPPKNANHTTPRTRSLRPNV
ncbi:hypothetical protein M407DRAFT_22923 [Tulasnella calospora MUT 4182]|uniref:Uncharacterized protein n=1 Tax=Tulasnella calospora MUT 4182 TaxID=1051891 RepID=A0A0C3QBJ4_9AGAM|nr:hypothetical protein M407DRAFT_22923 [Tulasnella calospora MUT 4182]